MAGAEILRHPDDDSVAHAVAARLVTSLVDVQSRRRVPSVVLTGGSIAVKIHQAVADSPARDAVDWSRVDVWFGDERFVPGDDGDRNVGQASVMLDHLPFDPARVHPMPPSDGRFGDDVEAAAESYAEQLRKAAAAEDGGETPTFDVVMLGIGPDGHCASLFPDHPARNEKRPVVAVRDSPKPPPTRITLTQGPLSRAQEVWWVAAGEEKADAVARAVSGSGDPPVPAAGPRGLSRTLWLLDSAAASRLPW